MHAAREILTSGANYDRVNSPIWRVLIALVGVSLFLFGVQEIGESLSWGQIGGQIFANDGSIDVASVLRVTGRPAISFASLTGAIILLARGFGPRSGYHWTVMAIGLSLTGGIIHNDILTGQASAAVLLLLTAGLALRSQDRVVAASVAFAVMMSLQPFTGVALLYFALRGDWKTVRWSLGVVAAVLIASLLSAWPNTIKAAVEWSRSIQHLAASTYAAAPDNESAYGLFHRMFAKTSFSTPWLDSPNLVPVLMTLAVSLTSVLAVVGIRLGRREDDEEEIGPAPAVLLLECSLVLALAAGLGPFTEASHLTFSLAGLAGALIVGLRRIQEKPARAMSWMIVIAAWLLPVLIALLPQSAWPAYGIDPASPAVSGQEILLTGRSAIALLLAGATTAIALWRERKAVAQAVIPKRPFGRRRSLRQPA